MYTITDFERDIQAIKPRTFDRYVLPGFLMAYAYKSKKMPVNARRALFVSGVYAAYRSYADYKKLIASMAGRLTLVNLESQTIDTEGV